MKNSLEKTQIGSINILRFMAAMSVMMYHYTFMFYQRGTTYLDFGILRSFFHYGYLGVDLFFIISGFVVALSAEGRNFREFLSSRVTRLYPILWISATLTFIVSSIWGYVVGLHTTFATYITNLTMVPTLFGQGIIDGSYWSLTVELKFYAFVGALILLGLFRYIERIATLLAPILFIAVFFFGLAPNYIANFIAGMLFYTIYKEGLSSSTGIASLLMLAVSTKYATHFAQSLSEGYHTVFSTYVIGAYIVAFYILFFGIATQKITVSNTKILTVLGALTYPVYLLHQEIGRIFFKIVENAGWNNWIAFVLVSGMVIGVAYLLQAYYEKAAQRILRNTLSRILKIKKRI